MFEKTSNNEFTSRSNDEQKNIEYLKKFHLKHVPQNVFLIDNSVRKNITFGIDDKFIDENQLDYSLNVAQIKDFVDSLPEGKLLW